MTALRRQLIDLLYEASQLDGARGWAAGLTRDLLEVRGDSGMGLLSITFLSATATLLGLFACFWVYEENPDTWKVYLSLTSAIAAGLTAFWLLFLVLRMLFRLIFLEFEGTSSHSFDRLHDFVYEFEVICENLSSRARCLAPCEKAEIEQDIETCIDRYHSIHRVRFLLVALASIVGTFFAFSSLYLADTSIEHFFFDHGPGDHFYQSPVILGAFYKSAVVLVTMGFGLDGCSMVDGLVAAQGLFSAVLIFMGLGIGIAFHQQSLASMQKNNILDQLELRLKLANDWST